MDLQKIADSIRKNINLNPGKKLPIVCANRDYDAMLEDAFLLTAEGGVEKVVWTTSIGGELADGAVIRLTEDGDVLLALHESRPNSKNNRPNGIRVYKMGVPVAVVYNSGSERLTVEGKWIEPGCYEPVCPNRERDMGDPEVREAFDAFLRSPQVTESIKETIKAFDEKNRR